MKTKERTTKAALKPRNIFRRKVLEAENRKLEARLKAAGGETRKALNERVKKAKELEKQVDGLNAKIDTLKKLLDERNDFIQRIADALGTAETGDNLVAVARDAHQAELKLSAQEIAADNAKND